MLNFLTTFDVSSAFHLYHIIWDAGGSVIHLFLLPALLTSAALHLDKVLSNGWIRIPSKPDLLSTFIIMLVLLLI